MANEHKRDVLSGRTHTPKKNSTSPCGTNTSKRLPLWKKCLFGTFTVAALFLLIELMLAVVGVTPASRHEDPFVGFATQFPHFVEQSDPEGAVEVHIAANKLKHFNPQTFPKVKPPGVFRIFCLGGSTTYGRPFFDNTSFCGWLRVYLPVAAPNKHWEVINAGGISYASYRVSAVARELAGYDPDLFIVYTGHNEFLERRTYENLFEKSWWTKVAAGLVFRTRTGTVLRHWSEQLRLTGADAPEPIHRLSDDIHAIPVDTIGPEAYTRDRVWQDRVLKDFRRILQGMVDLARDANAKMLFVLPASNLRDFSPFRSEHRDPFSQEDRRLWDTALRQARRFRREGQWDAALEMYQKAERLDEHYANLQYEVGHVLLAMGKPSDARGYFVRARDDDICPLRAISAISDIIAEVANERGVATVDFPHILESKTPDGLLGDESFYDHVHPRVESNRLLALAIIKKLGVLGMARLAPSWEGTMHDVTESANQSADHSAQAAELRKLALMLEWLGHGDQAMDRAREALMLSDESPAMLEFVGSLGLRLQQHETAEYAYQKLADVNTGSAETKCKLGMALVLGGKLDQAAREFEKSLALDPDLVDAHHYLGLVRTQQGRFVDAIVHLSKVTRLEPDSPAGYNNLGLALAKAGRTSEAMAEYRTSLQLNPGFASAHYNYGLALEDSGDTDGAIEQYKSALQAEPEHAGALGRLRALHAAEPDARTRP